MMFSTLLALLPAALAASKTTAYYTFSPSLHPDLCLAPSNSSQGADLVLAKCTDTHTVFRYSLKTGKIKNANDKTCIDVRDGVLANGTQAQMWSCFECNSNQAFDFVKNGDNGRYNLHWIDSDYCLDVKDGVGLEGTSIQIWPCIDYNDNQKWIVRAADKPTAAAPADEAAASDAAAKRRRRHTAKHH